MHAVLKQTIKSAAVSALRGRSSLRAAVLQAAARRGRALVLCYHVVGPSRGGYAVVPTVTPEHFAAQVDALKEIGDIVPLDWLLRARSASRPMFAITFDDDDPSHVSRALPILKNRQIHATFFLSGRSLHELGPYWWTRVEHSVNAIGLAATCDALGVRALTLRELVRKCRHSASVVDLPLATTTEVMTAADIRALSNAGMTIGFHTVRHQALTLLDDGDLRCAVMDGRDVLADAAAASIESFAYPYGMVDRRVADAVSGAGYRWACALGDRPLSSLINPFCIPRWQPGAVAVSDLSGETALRLTGRLSRFDRAAS
jgi:peptidoglycan/xylan/chitin deacetylase (PgdA/CDA1 family)